MNCHIKRFLALSCVTRLPPLVVRVVGVVLAAGGLVLVAGHLLQPGLAQPVAVGVSGVQLQRGEEPAQSSRHSHTPTPSPAYPWLWVFMGLFMTRSLGSRWMKTLRTQGDIRWVWGERKWMLSTTTVTQMLQHHSVNSSVRSVRTRGGLRSQN